MIIEVMTIKKQQTVAHHTICVLVIVCLLSLEINAVEEEILDKIQLNVEGAERTVDDKSNEIIQSSKEIVNSDKSEQTIQRPRIFKASDEEGLGMDSLTIIWYLTTFTALFGFFIVMACTEKTCGRNAPKPTERTCPPTPCPSYKHFAPPSYDSVMKKYKNPRVFIVPVHENNNFFNQGVTDNNIQNPVSATTTIVDIEKPEEIATQK
ncbi:CLUMA_CG018849, isoform A [Clunio marinus]|uniref:CLUMA_CG018849, isoform A n=1 Tax=Clunio marinus TaxID=568069 RepID=A0A1J1J2Y3_9DIPT|nr:CLUMA_CG018849, isoform A [Clunio marinus]